MPQVEERVAPSPLLFLSCLTAFLPSCNKTNCIFGVWFSVPQVSGQLGVFGYHPTMQTEPGWNGQLVNFLLWYQVRPRYLISDFKKSYLPTLILKPASRRHSNTSRKRTMWSSTVSVAMTMSSIYAITKLRCFLPGLQFSVALALWLIG